MAFLCKSFLLVAFASIVLAVDRTVEEGAVGADVVVATISKIESANIFPSDKRLLRRIAFVETSDGEDPPSTGRYGGIWNVKREKFGLTKGNQSLILRVNAAFEVEFSELSLGGRDWNSVEWEDLNVPLLSALAARLLIHYIDTYNYNTDIPTSSDIEGQALFWKTHYNTAGNENEFIQDVKDLDQDEGCTIISDIIFVLDSSGSIGYVNYLQVIEFAYKFADSLDIGPTENQVGVVIFSSYGFVFFNLSTYSDKMDLLSAINTIPYISGGTDTADGLLVLIEEGFTEESGARLSASNVYRLAIVMTDGHSNDIIQTKEAAEAVHNFYPPILVFAIGVTNFVNREELEAIATKDEYITFLSQFDESQFVETRDEQTYELCVKSTIPARLGQQTGTLTKGESVRYELNVPQDGVTVRLCVQEGYIIFYTSLTVTNPNEALHDYKREVINEGTTKCDDAYINPADPEVNTLSRHAGGGQFSGNVTLYVALDGVEERNEFELNTSEGDTTAKDEPAADGESHVAVIVVCVIVVLLLAGAIYHHRHCCYPLC